MQPPEQHGAEDHVVLATGGRDPPRPGQVHQACGAHPALAGQSPQPLILLRGQFGTGQLEITGLVLQTGKPIGQRRLIDIAQFGPEKRLMLGLADTQQSLGHIVAVRHRRPCRRLAVQVIANLCQHHFHGGVVEHDVVELQHDLHPCRIMHMQQPDQRRRGKLDALAVEHRVLFCHLDQRQVRRAQYNLHRLGQAIPEHRRAQHVVAGHHLVEGLGKGMQPLQRIEGNSPLQQVRVDTVCTEMVIENALLQRRQWVDILDVGRAAGDRSDDAVQRSLLQRQQGQHGRGDAGAVGRDTVGRDAYLTGCAQRPGQCRHRRLREQNAHIQGQALFAQPLDQAHGQQRMPAQFEEIVVPADLLQAQHVGPDLGDDGLGFTQRGLVPLLHQVMGLWLGQRATVELAVAGQGQRLNADKGLRHQLTRQARLQALAQVAHLDGRRLGEPGQQAFAAHQHHGIADTGLPPERGLDFTQLHPDATHLDLVVVTAQVVKRAIAVPAHQVAAAVHAGVGQAAERVTQEAFCGQVRPVEIASRHLRATDVELAGDPDRHRLAQGIEHVDTGIGNGHADVQGCAGCQRTGGGDHGAFSRAVVVDHGESWVLLELTQAIAAHQQGAQRGVLVWAAQRLFSHRRRQEADRQGLFEPPVQQRLDLLIAQAGRRQVQRGPRAQGWPDFPGHGVETETSHAGGACAPLHGKCLAVPVDKVGHCLVLDHDAFGLAGGT